MNYFLKILLTLILALNVMSAQIKPTITPLSFNQPEQLKFEIVEAIDKIIFDKNNELYQYHFNATSINNYYFTINSSNVSHLSFFLINSENNSYIGPYTEIDAVNSAIITDIIKGKNFILEINNSNKSESPIINLSIKINNLDILSINQKTINPFKSREEPIILLTGYWPPTNEMLRHFSQNDQLNTNGWQGDNWEDRGYDIISYFPEFSNPDCSSCGQGFGDLEVDYQDTSEDFWPIFNSHSPIAVITFSRGYMNESWELEYNAYNRTNWINDFTSPFLPTPNPPDSNEDAFFLRNSNLPMENIVNAIDALDINLNPYIDADGDPGHYVSEFMAYHGTWYRDLNQFGENSCIAAGHIHVGGNIDWDTAKIATEETIRTVIDYLNDFIYTPGDINDDNYIDILDLVIIMNYILGNTELSTTQLFASDLNEDGIINVQDIIIVINIILNND